MKEENKYYTPSPKEFHIGFRYEIESIDKEGNKIWVKKYFTFNKFGISQATNERRVKYLDKDDIEELGFNLKEVSADLKNKLVFSAIGIYRGEESVFRLVLNEVSHWVLIVVDGSTVFAGFLNNYNELEKQLKKCNVILK